MAYLDPAIFSAVLPHFSHFFHNWYEPMATTTKKFDIWWWHRLDTHSCSSVKQQFLVHNFKIDCLIIIGIFKLGLSQDNGCFYSETCEFHLECCHNEKNAFGIFESDSWEENGGEQRAHHQIEWTKNFYYICNERLLSQIHFRCIRFTRWLYECTRFFFHVWQL